ncbi:hypothetical protein T265_07084 [Opisthorchis viverrini]|uniref:MORN repeat protein n=2 Tax=Opisthorchis viverrini TaxID=6198 RepID=A0A074ZDV0_OPIVI|nr:hypothetical protein T265_07084 [Opisthorchis viverrini]KER25461.1 hypothetical protein T265_07084 [Opisthorchis viverrini]
MSDDEAEDIEEEEGVYLGEYDGGRNERDERHGYGKAILPNGDAYDGMYENGKRHGPGIYRFKNGARYDGAYYDGKKHGQGTFYYPDGSVYEATVNKPPKCTLGLWVENQRNGVGKYTYVNGDVYEGEWRDHLRHGQGSYTFAASKLRYEGTWKEGKIDGFGELIHESHKYIGFWKDGMVMGRGRYVFPKLECQQTGEYLATPAKDEERLPEDDADKLIPRWKAQKLERLVEEVKVPKPEAQPGPQTEAEPEAGVKLEEAGK